MAQEQSTWEQVFDLVATALELAPAERKAYVEGAAVDSAVRAEALSLIAASEQKETDLLERGLEAFAPALADVQLHSYWSGRRLGAYQVLQELGEGGMGLVLMAERADGLYERKVAIKVIRLSLASEQFVRRFQRETRILARLDHPAITSLLDAGITEEKLPFLVMEFVDGLPIHQYAERKRLSLPGVLKLAITLCEALAHAHKQGVVHQDVKPSNILVNAQGQLKLLDFGIAHLADVGDVRSESTHTAFRAVTPAYASPEQIRGGRVDARTDIYSVGVVLYVMLTGGLPFDLEGLSVTEIEQILKTGDATIPSRKAVARFGKGEVAALDAVIGKAMHPNPERRYGSAEELKGELTRILAGQNPSVSKHRYLAARWWRRRKATAKWVALGAAGVAAACMVAFRLSHENRTPTTPDTGRISVAVLPIATSADQTWIVHAVQQALGTELSSGDQIRVISPASVAQGLRDLHLTTDKSIEGSAGIRLGQLLDTRYLVEVRATPTSAPNTVHLEGSLYRASNGQAVTLQGVDGSSNNLEESSRQLALKLARVLPVHRALARSPSLLPRSTEAVRSYTEGLTRLQALEPIPARDLFERAAVLEPGSPVVHVALARTWNMLGYRQKAMAEAERAISLDSGLPVRTKLMLEAEANEIRREWPAAIAAYSKLRDYDPDEVDYVLGLARCQFAGGDGKSALATLQHAEQMPALLGADPRLQLLASIVEEGLSEHAIALQQADGVLTAARERGATQLMAQAQSARASALESLGKVDEGMKAAQQAQRLFTETGDIEGEATNLVATGNFLEDHARYEEAKRCYQEAKDIFTRTGDEAHAAVAENDLGIVADDLGDPREALARYIGALQTFRQVGEKQRIPSELNNIGTIQNELDESDAAKRSYREALDLLKQLHDDRRVAQAYNNLGFLSIKQGDLDEAEHDFQQAFQIYSSSGQKAGTIYSTIGLAHVAWNRGQLDEAHRKYQEAIRIAQQIPEPRLIATALRADAHVLHDRGDEELARKDLAESQAMRETHHETIAAAQTKLSAIVFDLDNGRSVTPDLRFEELLAVFVPKKDNADAADTQIAWTTSLLLQKRTTEAVQHLTGARLLMSGIRSSDLKRNYSVAAAELTAKRGDTSGAERQIQTCLQDAKQHRDLPAEMKLRLISARLRAEAHRPPDARLPDHLREAKAHKFLRVAAGLEALQEGKRISSVR